MADTVLIKHNQREPRLRARIVDSSGVAVNLSGAVGVTFSMRSGRDLTNKIASQPAVITDAPEGRIEYQWRAGDTDTLGNFNAEFLVNWGNGVTEIFPTTGAIRVRIIPPATIT
jgi:hypothetical protein